MDELEAQARAILDPAPYDYFAGGAGDEITLRENTEAWSRLRLSPKMLVDVASCDPSVEVIGQRLAHPLLVAPMAYQKHAHDEGESGMARAAAAAGAGFVLSSQTTTAPADVAAAAPDVTRWFQLYVFRDRAISFDLVEQARESGYRALVVTVDFPVGGVRYRDQRSGFRVEHPSVVARGPMTIQQAFAAHDPSLTWDDLAAFADAARMPLLLKGILRPDDARRAADVGAAGVIVSNHGGRQLDTVLTGAEALPAVAAEVGDEIDVLVDGGIRRGWDVAKALALGAKAVLVGRRALWGLTVGGAEGAQRELERIADEFDATLALLGCPKARDLDATYLVP